MMLETTQLLYTAFYLNNSQQQLKHAPLCLSTGQPGYKPVHNKKHPSVIWAAESLAHWIWLVTLGLYLVDEYKFRYGQDKTHGCEEHLLWLSRNPPKGLFQKRPWIRAPPPAMPDQYIVEGDSITSYRNFYRGSKQDRGLLTYTRRHKPHFI